MSRGIKKLRALTVRRYAARLIDLNEYLESFPGKILNDKISVTKLKEILLNSMPKIWSRQAYVQGFDCESITLKSILICLSVWKLPSIFTKVYYNLLIKNLPRQTPTVMVKGGKIEENQPRHGL